MGAEALQPAELPVERCSAGPGLGPISHTTVLPSVLSAWRRGSTQRQSKAPCPVSRSGRLWACVLGFAVCPLQTPQKRNIAELGECQRCLCASARRRAAFLLCDR